ncbi:MAG: tetratricopeptide repeat protein [Burkholderiales bacterium]
MFRVKLLLAALAAAGIAAAAAPSREVKPEFIGLGSALCRPPAGNPANYKLLLKVAQAQNELKPFSRAQATAPLSEEDDPPLWDNLGWLKWPITTSDKLAQLYFNQGLSLTYGFNHDEARRAYRKAQKLDPECAMCYWGEALVLGPNINAPMAPEANAPALASLEKAREFAHRASPVEQALIAALSERYSPDPEAKRSDLDLAYANAMAKVAASFPDDQHIATLYAEALMDLSPWDYWEAAGAKPKGRTEEILKTLERVLLANPNHPGAIHYYIHMVEASANPKRALPYARRLGDLIPGAGHLVHMPFHIFYRAGLYKEAIEANKAAVAADEEYLAQIQATGLYPQGYYPHNVHSLMASAQMAGDGETAISAAEKLQGIVSNDAARNVPWVQPIVVAPYFAHVQFSTAKTILAIPDPGGELPYVKAIWHYARGVALARNGDSAAARGELGAISALAQTPEIESLAASGIPAGYVLQIAQHVVKARIAQSSGDLATAISEFETAAKLEDALAYSEPPYWYYPVRQSLGAALLAAGKLDQAEQAFRTSLARSPNNGWALYGLQKVFEKRGDQTQARSARKLFDRAWAGDALSLRNL